MILASWLLEQSVVTTVKSVNVDHRYPRYLKKK
jgi:hypothetical protein